MLYDLVVVMPVYNEQDCIVSVLQSWDTMLSNLKINFRILVLNDGSKDGTQEALNTLRDNEHIEISHKPNSGHGPTILMGYHKAVEMGQWVFQCDSDDEMKAEHFPQLWTERDQYVALFGIRANRLQESGRKLISTISRFIVKRLFGTANYNVHRG